MLWVGCMNTFLFVLDNVSVILLFEMSHVRGVSGQLLDHSVFRVGCVAMYA